MMRSITGEKNKKEIKREPSKKLSKGRGSSMKEKQKSGPRRNLFLGKMFQEPATPIKITSPTKVQWLTTRAEWGKIETTPNHG